MKSLTTNTVLQNRYVIVNLIGKGGMGEVYLAIDQRLGNHVALKRTFFNDDEILAPAFEREARTLANLRHPVLPKVSDHFTENENQYLVMEFISGDDLSKRIETTKKPFPLNWVLFWADELLDALAYLHSQNPPIIHRDIKPQNLKLTADNHIILLDFGLAKNTQGKTKVSTTGSIVGYTPHYAPMEQIRGTGTNQKSDIYSLSATLYQLLTGNVPPDALSRADELLSKSADPIKPLNSINAEIPGQISTVILKGMSFRQEDRFNSAREMQKVLREAFTESQQIMNANTVAFSTNDGVQQSNIKTEQFSAPPASAGQEKTAEFPAIAEPSPDFGATLKMGSPALGEKTEVLPIEEKTEILPFPVVTAQNDSQNTDKTDSFQPVGDKTEIMPSSEPLLTEQVLPVKEERIQPLHGSFTDNPESETVIVGKKPETKSKSKGSLIGILAGVVVFGLLVVVGGGLGWYYFVNNTTQTTTTNSSSNNKPTPEKTPQNQNLAVEANNSVNADSNSSANSSTNENKSSVDNTSVSDNKNSEIEEKTTVTDKTKVTPTPAPTQITTQTPTIVVKPTPKPTQIPTATVKPTPAPKVTPQKPVKSTGGKTDIEQ